MDLKKSLPRILEAEVMDSVEEARDYDAMDHSEVNRLFVADFLSFWNREGPILDLGTGTAQIPIELCRQAQGVAVMAVDLAAHMLKRARQNLQQAGLENRVRLKQCDAKDLPFAGRQFGAAISNSIIHHIPEPRAVLAEMVRVVRAGAWVFVRDLLRPIDEGMLQDQVRRYAGMANSHQQEMFGNSLRAALTLEEIRNLVADLGFEPVSVQQTSDRHWTWKTVVGE